MAKFSIRHFSSNTIVWHMIYTIFGGTDFISEVKISTFNPYWPSKVQYCGRNRVEYGVWMVRDVVDVFPTLATVWLLWSTLMIISSLKRKQNKKSKSWNIKSYLTMIMSLTISQKKRKTMENLKYRPTQASYQETLISIYEVMNIINDIHHF